MLRISSTCIGYSLVLALLYSHSQQALAKLFEQEKSLTKEQENFLRELAEYDDALWEQETKSLFKKYSQVNTTVKELPKATKSQQENPNVIIFKLPESELFTPEGINLTAILAALNRNTMDKLSETTTAKEEATTTNEVEEETKVEATTAEPVTEAATELPQKLEDSQSTLRSDLSNSTGIVMNLNNNGTSDTRNETIPENHIFSQVQKIITASAQRNISGILDASLRITGNTELTNFVNGIFGVVYCNAIRRLLGRC